MLISSSVRKKPAIEFVTSWMAKPSKKELDLSDGKRPFVLRRAISYRKCFNYYKMPILAKVFDGY